MLAFYKNILLRGFGNIITSKYQAQKATS